MAPLKWNPALSVEVPEMDAEHKRLVAIINRLNEAVRGGQRQDEVLQIFNELTVTARNHFASEECFMVSIGYPHLGTQKIEHARLLQKLADFQQEFRTGEAVISPRLTAFLKDWLTNHIQKSDKKYGRHARQHI